MEYTFEVKTKKVYDTIYACVIQRLPNRLVYTEPFPSNEGISGKEFSTWYGENLKEFQSEKQALEYAKEWAAKLTAAKRRIALGLDCNGC